MAKRNTANYGLAVRDSFLTEHDRALAADVEPDVARILRPRRLRSCEGDDDGYEGDGQPLPCAGECAVPRVEGWGKSS